MNTQRSRLAVALALVALVAPSTFSAPATRSSCTPVCRQSQESSKIRYQEGKSYTYGFETEVVTSVLGSSDEQSKIKVKGQAVIAVQSACDYILTVQQIAFQSPSGKAISKVDDIEGSSLRFSYQNGQIDSVCVSEDDSTWSANVKRAIISMLTNTNEHGGVSTETDISGQCPTVYTVTGDKYVKTRNLNACTNRDGGATVLMGVPYDAPASHNYNSISMIDSVLECTQELKDGIFQTVSCTESHSVPFLSTASSGVHTEIKSSLNFISSTPGLTKGSRAPSKTSSVLYDHSEASHTKSSSSRMVDVVKKICQEIEDGAVSSKVPALYLQLIKSLKSIRKDDVKSTYEKISSGTMCSRATEKLTKIFVDAAATSGSDGAIAFLSELIAGDQAGCHAKALFNVNAAFATQPDIVALEALGNLISKSDVEVEYLLTASAVAHQYCKMTNDKCGSNNEYHALVDKIAAHVRSPQEGDEEAMRRVVGALQALGNLDALTPAAVSAISALIDGPSTGERVKVRALDAFRRDPCQSVLKTKATKVFGDVKESSHVRIQAYLTIAKCVDQDDVRVLQNTLNGEQSSQVGSFVASHIENTIESASPSKSSLRTTFSQFTIPEGLRKDVRKFSRNTEYSTFFPKSNLGGALEGNMIFSQDSFLPRMASANLTMDAFGRSYNFLEMGIYAEDFEHLVEKIFGPAGKIRQTNLEQLMSQGSQKLSNLVEGVRNRFKRDVKTSANQNEIDVLKRKVDIHERTGDSGVGDVYIRVMGTSMMVESFNEASLREGSLSSKFQKGVKELLDGAKDSKFDLTYPIVFVDEELILPTFSGLPLNLELKGTSVLSMQMSGNLDVTALFRSGEGADMRAKFVPSAATLLKSRMTVGAGPIESGLQLEGKIHSAAGVDVKMVKEQGKFELRLNLPQERTQVIDMRSDLYWVEQPQDAVEQKNLVQGKLATKSLINNDCMTTFSTFLGLKVCADVKVPQASLSAPFVLLNGPAVMSLSVEKSESSMEGYYLKVEKDAKDDETLYSFLVDTPGSRTNRKVSASLKASKYRSTTPEYVFRLESPWTKLDVDYKRSFTDELKGIELKIVADGDAYNGKMQLKRVKAGSVNKYEPIISYNLPGGRPVKLVEGQVLVVEGQRKMEIDLRTAGPMKSLRGSVKGTLEMPQKNDGFEVKAKNLEFSSDMVGKIAFDGHLIQGRHILDSKLHAKYGSEKQHSFEFENKLEKPKHGHYEFTTKTRSSRVTFLNFDAHGKVTREGNTCNSELVYSRGLTEPKVHFSHKLRTKIESRKEFEIFHETIVKHPALGLDMFSKLDTKAAPGAARFADLTFNINSLKTKAKYESEGQNVLEYKVKATAEYSAKTYEFTETSTKAGDNKLNFKTKFSVTPGSWYAADTDVVHKFEKSDMESSLDTVITSDTFSDPITFKSGVKGKSDGYMAHTKLDMKAKNYVDFATQFKHSKASKPATLTMKSFVLNYLDAKLTQTMSRSQSDLQIDIKWIPTGRKIESKSRLSNDGDIFNLDADLKWDAEKDATKSASIKSVTNLSLSKFTVDSKNDITLEGKLAKFNLKGKAMKEWFNGEDNLEIDIVSPAGKTYKFATVLNLENKLKVKGGNINVKVTLDGQRPYDFTWNNRITNLNPHEMTFEAVTDMKIDYKGEKDATFHGELGSVKPGNFKTYTGKVDIGGSVVKQPISANVKADLKQGKFGMKAAASHGTRKGDFDVVMDYEVYAPKKTLDVKYTINTPFDNFQSIEGTHKHGFLYTSLRNFEYTEEGSFSMNHGSPAQWKYLSSVLNTEFKYLSEFMNEGKSVYLISADGKLTPKTFVSEIQATYRDDKAFLNIDIDHQMPQLSLNLKGGIPSTSFELKATHNKLSDGVYETDVLAKTKNEIAFRVTNKLELTSTKKSIDLTVAADQQPPRRMYFLLNKASADKYNLESMLVWGEGNKFLSTKGDLSKSSEGYDATLVLDSPALKANKMNVKLSKKSVSGRHTVNLKMVESAKDKFSAAFDYGTTLERSGAGKVYEGSVAVKGDKTWVDVEFNGKFKLEDSTLARSRGDGEDGRQFRGSFEVGRTGTPIKGSALIKTSDKEKRVQASLCNEAKGRCRSGDAHFRHSHEANGDLEYTVRITGETDVSGQKSITGVVIRTAKAQNGDQLDHTVKLILNHENSEQIGYRFYRKDGHEFGSELLLPERVIATVLDCKRNGPTDVNLELAFYIDRTRQPTRKISLILNTERKKSTMGREIEFIFRHPDMDKDLKVHTKYSILGDVSQFLEVKTVLDVFKAGSEIVMAYKANRDAIVGGHMYTSQWSVLSKGQQINFGGKTEITARSGQLTYKQDIHYENRDKQIKTAKIESQLSMNRMSFEVKGHSGKFVSLISTFEDVPSGYEYRSEVLFPGMEDARIFQAILTTTSPRKAQLKTYTASSPTGVFYEAILGFKNNDHFLIGVYDHETSGKKTLADFNVELNKNRVLSMKTNWEKDNFKNVWTKTQARVDRNGRNLKEMVGSGLEEAVKELQFFGSNLVKAAPNVKPALTSGQRQWADLIVELDAHQDTKVIVEKMEAAQGFFRAYVRFLSGLTKAARRVVFTMVGMAREQIQQLPEKIKAYTDKFPYNMDDVQEWIDNFAETLEDWVKNGLRLMEQAVERVSSSMPEIIKGINWALDMTSEMSASLRKCLESALNKVTVWYKSVRSYTKDFIDSDLVRMFVRDTAALIQAMLSEFIEESKDYAESFKNYLLNAIPEQDFQELVQLTVEYVEKKAKNTPVDDTAAIKEIYDKFITLVKKVGKKFFSVDSTEGSFGASVMLPSPVTSLGDIMKIFDKFSFPSPPVIEYNLPSYKFGFSEIYNKLRHGASIDQFVPPYDAHALIIGSQFYKTFDGQFFRFDGSCQYLLASDMEDGNFTIAVDYERTGSNVAKAIIVKDSADTIAIKSDNTVVINDRTYSATDLDREFQNTTNFKVERSRDWIVVTGTKKGVKVGCSTLHDVCAVKVSGFYHGKVLGLLGKFNQEKFDDLTTPDGKISENTNEFTESWKLNSGCRERPVISLPVITSEASQRCSDAFESRASTLRPCFGVVAPQEYKRMCERLSSAPGYDVSKAVCTSSAGYAKACYLSYASVELPTECRRV